MKIIALPCILYEFITHDFITLFPVWGREKTAFRITLKEPFPLATRDKDCMKYIQKDSSKNRIPACTGFYVERRALTRKPVPLKIQMKVNGQIPWSWEETQFLEHGTCAVTQPPKSPKEPWPLMLCPVLKLILVLPLYLPFISESYKWEEQVPEQRGTCGTRTQAGTHAGSAFGSQQAVCELSSWRGHLWCLSLLWTSWGFDIQPRV